MADDTILSLLDIAVLIAQQRTRSLSPIERTAFDTWLAAEPGNKTFFEELNGQDWLDEALAGQDPDALRASAARVYAALGMEVSIIPIPRPRRVRLIVRWTAAAAIIGLIATGGWLGFFHHRTPAVTITTPTTTHDIAAPSGARTTLTLADGRKVALDSLQNGVLAQQGAVRVTKPDARQLSYQAINTTTATAILYNTLTTARGGQTMVALADGTKVWLNAESSLRYPTVFGGGAREVELSGEAYFEVAHEASHPFRVHVGKTIVEDIGTQFDVNAYTDEPELKASLLEGAIRVDGRTLVPGEQAAVGEGGNLVVRKGIDAEEVLGWKNGEFIFRRTDMAAILRQIGRWYDVDIVTPVQPVRRTFSGIVSRKSNLSEVMKIFEGANIRFRIEGKKLTLLQ